MRLLVLSIALMGAMGLHAQAPQFDAVSIKVNASGESMRQFGGRPGGLQIRNNSLRDIIRNVWNMNGMQIVGGPEWLDQARFDILATSPGNPPRDQIIAMAKNMLADRFTLVVHNETRPLPIYALVMSRADGQLGPTLRRSTMICNAPAPGATPPVPPAPPEPLGGVDVPVCGTRTGNGILQAGGIELENFTRNMAGPAGRLIVNKTGLTGAFDMVLRFNMDPANPSSELPSVFAAVQEQLGLKLEPQTGPVDVLVIDRAEKPTEN